MQFIVKAYDGEGMLEKRMAGCWMSPYVLEGVWQKIEVERMNVVIPKQ